MNFMNGILEKLIKNSMNMKGDFDKLKSELQNRVVTATSGGGMIKVEANARLEILKIEIEESVLKTNDRVMLQELLKSAVNEALKKAEQTAVEELKDLGTKLNLPIDPGMFIK
jgi:nucleoid-associated protein EbfC